MDQHEIEKQAKERAQIAASDPLTVIGQAKKNLYEGGRADPWLEEVVTRFEAQQRAALGTNAFVPAGRSSG